MHTPTTKCCTTDIHSDRFTQGVHDVLATSSAAPIHADAGYSTSGPGLAVRLTETELQARADGWIAALETQLETRHATFFAR